MLLENKIQLRTFEDLIGFIKRLVERVASYPATRRALERLYKLGGFTGSWAGHGRY